MRDDQYMVVLQRTKADAAEEGAYRLLPLLQWLMNFRPATHDGDDVEYMTTAEIQVALAEMVSLDLNEISSVMCQLGYQVSLALTHPSWPLLRTDC